MVLVLRAQSGRLRIGIDVGLAGGKTEAVLIDRGDLGCRIPQVLTRAESKEGIEGDEPTGGARHVRGDGMQTTNERRETVTAFQCLDPVQFRFESSQTLQVDRALVHARGVVIAGLLQVGSAARRFQDALEAQEGAFLDLAGPAPSRAIRRKGILRLPAAARKEIEVRARVGRPVQRLEIDAGCRSGRGRLL